MDTDILLEYGSHLYVARPSRPYIRRGTGASASEAGGRGDRKVRVLCPFSCFIPPSKWWERSVTEEHHREQVRLHRPSHSSPLLGSGSGKHWTHEALQRTSMQYCLRVRSIIGTLFYAHYNPGQPAGHPSSCKTRCNVSRLRDIPQTNSRSESSLIAP
ncbi:hypothetical protein L226DRAFT_319369 [Lentinus tigrinus ALCF2SS1-7]|uniref:uncharacterized protein n=1 Tax=Lentinus tigrinus ALCF2SS1-7 TaxID=1328758 RepID=UPI00116601BC|nr:hypothetical protein L226DRAFT_319369 [Lentinus tigrinus ALCF2SS1-7]